MKKEEKAILGKLGLFWASLGKFGQVWLSLGNRKKESCTKGACPGIIN